MNSIRQLINTPTLSLEDIRIKHFRKWIDQLADFKERQKKTEEHYKQVMKEGDDTMRLLQEGLITEKSPKLREKLEKEIKEIPKRLSECQQAVTQITSMIVYVQNRCGSCIADIHQKVMGSKKK